MVLSTGNHVVLDHLLLPGDEVNDPLAIYFVFHFREPKLLPNEVVEALRQQARLRDRRWIVCPDQEHELQLLLT